MEIVATTAVLPRHPIMLPISLSQFSLTAALHLSVCVCLFTSTVCVRGLFKKVGSAPSGRRGKEKKRDKTLEGEEKEREKQRGGRNKSLKSLKLILRVLLSNL